MKISTWNALSQTDFESLECIMWNEFKKKTAVASGRWKIGDDEEKWVQVDHFQRSISLKRVTNYRVYLHVLTTRRTATFFLTLCMND